MGSTSKSSTSKGSGSVGTTAVSDPATKPPINPTTAKSSSKSSTAKGASIGALGSPSGGSKSNKAAGTPGISQGKPSDGPSLCNSPNNIKPAKKSSSSGGPGTGAAVFSSKSDKSSSSKPIPETKPEPVPDPIVPATKPPTPRPTAPCKDCDEIIPDIVPGDKPTPTGPTPPSGDVPRPTPPSPPLTPSEVVIPPPPSPTSPDSPPAPTGGDPDPIIPGPKPTPVTPPSPTPADRPTEPTAPTPPATTPPAETEPISPPPPSPTEPSPSSPTTPASPTEPTPAIIPGEKPTPETPPAPTPDDRPLEPAETPNIATNCLNDPSWTSTDGDNCEAVETNPVSLCNSASSSGGVSASAACPAACNTECLDNCDVNPNWSTGSGETCDDVAKDPIGLCGSVGTTSGSGATVGGVTAIDACPTSCKDECLDNCDNDPFWITKDDETCDDVATDPKGLCDKLKSKDDDEKASTACPAACNLDCYDNCDDSPFWENGDNQGCADVAGNPKAFCDTVDEDDVPANEACPASCNEECLLINEVIEEIDFPPPAPTTPSPPVPSPITPSGGGGGPMIGVPTYVPTGQIFFEFPTFKPTNGASVTVGQGAESAPTLPPAGRLGTPFPTEVVPTIPTAKPTSVASGGVTITVSTETTGPPTLENREPDSA